MTGSLNRCKMSIKYSSIHTLLESMYKGLSTLNRDIHSRKLPTRHFQSVHAPSLNWSPDNPKQWVLLFLGNINNYSLRNMDNGSFISACEVSHFNFLNLCLIGVLCFSVYKAEY